VSRPVVEMIGPCGRKVVPEADVAEHKRNGFTVVGETSVASDTAAPTPIEPTRVSRPRFAKATDEAESDGDSGEE